MLIGQHREMKRTIRIFVPMAMSVSVWTYEVLGTPKDFIMMNMKNKSRMIVVTSSAGFHSKTGAPEMLVRL